MAREPLFTHGSRIAFPILLILLAVTWLWVSYGLHTTTIKNRNALRSILCLAEENVQHVKGLDHKQRQNAVRFYAKALKEIGADPCRDR